MSKPTHEQHNQILRLGRALGWDRYTFNTWLWQSQQTPTVGGMTSIQADKAISDLKTRLAAALDAELEVA